MRILYLRVIDAILLEGTNYICKNFTFNHNKHDLYISNIFSFLALIIRYQAHKKMLFVFFISVRKYGIAYFSIHRVRVVY